MIHIFVGTKAQFIKMAPAMQELSRRGIHYNFIDTGQHAGLTEDLIKQFELRPPDVRMRQGCSNINTIAQALPWTVSALGRLFFRHKILCSNIFREGGGGICLIHGDTLTTLVSLLYAKRCGLPVVHVEAGLRSFHLFDPFPEEIVRLIAMRFSDLLFAPSEWAYKNLCRMGYAHKSVNVGANTGLDAVRYAVGQRRGQHGPPQPYVVVTIHRVETIFSRSRLSIITALIERIAGEYPVIFILHEPTRQQLLKHGLLDKIKSLDAVEISPLLPYVEFVELISDSEYVVTDGGSVQEECYYLNKPCMVMRCKTERLDGLGENAFLAGFDQSHMEQFFEMLPTLKRRGFREDLHPTEAIIEHVLSWA